MKITVAQIDTLMGDFDATAPRMVAASKVAKKQGVELMVFCSNVLTGTNPLALLDDPDFMKDLGATLSKLSRELAVPAVVPFMYALRGMTGYEAALVKDGDVVPLRLASMAGADFGLAMMGPAAPAMFHLNGLDFGVCFDEVMLDAYVDGRAAADVILYLGAEPFMEQVTSTQGVYSLVDGCFVKEASGANATIVCANPVGGSDNSVYTGGSFVLAPWGDLYAQAPAFEEAYMTFDVDPAREELVEERMAYPEMAPMEYLWNTLTLALRDYVEKNGYKGVSLVMTGDALTSCLAALATDALGPTRVHASVAEILSREAYEDAWDLAYNLHLDARPIVHSDLVVATVALGIEEPDAVKTLVRTVASRRDREDGLLSLTAEDKTALAQGFDVDGFRTCAWAPLSDVYRTDVLAMVSRRARVSPVFPEGTLSRVVVPDVAWFEELGSTDGRRATRYDMCVLRHIEDGMSVTELSDPDSFGPDAEPVIRDFHSHAPFRRNGVLGPVISVPFQDRMRPLTCGWRDRVHEGHVEGEDILGEGEMARRIEEALGTEVAEGVMEGVPVQIQNYLRDLATSGVFRPDADELWASGLFSNN
jgi:NAD+ synthase (glutamine-hydrolysing)